MVTITGYESRTNDHGETFYVLELQGEVEMAKSEKTGQLYATARRTTVSCTFDEQTCEQMVGDTLPGRIQKEETDPYKYTIPETGETVVLNHEYTYKPDADSLEGHVFDDGQAPV